METVTVTLETLCGCTKKMYVRYPPQPILEIPIQDDVAHRFHTRPEGGYPADLREFRLQHLVGADEKPRYHYKERRTHPAQLFRCGICRRWFNGNRAMYCQECVDAWREHDRWRSSLRGRLTRLCRRIIKKLRLWIEKPKGE